MKKKIVILGNSCGIPALIEAIRVNDQESDITIISPDGQAAYDRNLLPALMAKEINPAKALMKNADFYTKNKVQSISEKKVTKINFRKNQVTIEEKELIVDYDILIVSSLPERKLPDIKGVNKVGIFALDQLAAVDQFIKELPFVETVIVQSSSAFGLKMAEAIVKREKEVIMLVDSSLKSFEGTPSETIRVLLDHPMVEILGETDVRAVRLNSGKVIACDMIFFGELNPHFRLFQDTAVAVQDRIVVDACFKTNLDNVYAFDEAIEGASRTYLQEGEAYTQKVIEQAHTLASQITGQKVSVAQASENP